MCDVNVMSYEMRVAEDTQRVSHRDVYNPNI